MDLYLETNLHEAKNASSSFRKLHHKTAELAAYKSLSVQIKTETALNAFVFVSK
jgi:hypothetical protein